MLTKKFLVISLIFLSVAQADEDCKIINTPYNALKTDKKGHYTPQYPVLHFVKGATNILSERVVISGGFQPELAFSKIIAKWEKLAQVGFCPNRPTNKNVCGVVPFDRKNYGLRYNNGPIFLAGSLDFILEKQNELNSRGYCVNAEMEEIPKTEDSATPVLEEGTSLTREERRNRID